MELASKLLFTKAKDPHMNMNRKLIVQFVLLFLLRAEGYTTEGLKEIYLAPGEQEVISYSKLSSIAIGNRNIIDIKFPKNKQSLLMIAKAQGISSLILWENDSKKASYLIRVISPALKGLLLETQKSLAEVEGVSINILGEKLVIEGSVYKAQDKRKITSLANTSNGLIVDLVKINSELLPLTASLIEKGLKTNGFTDVIVSPVGEKISLKGEVPEKEDIERALEIAKAIYPDIIHSLSVSVNLEKMIIIDLKIAEIRRNISKAYGLKWQEFIDFKTNFGKSSGAAAAAAFSLGEGFGAKLNMLEAKGLVRVLSNPKLLCKNGKKGSFLAGGEIPIRLIGEKNSEVIFKDYGVILEIEPKIDKSNNVSLDIVSEVSELNPSTSVEGIPGLIKNKFSTSVNMRAGETIILAGLLENRASKNIDKIPLLGMIPILGELFKSRSFQKNESQFGVFITPILIDSGSDENRSNLESIKKGLNESEEKVKANIFD